MKRLLIAPLAALTMLAPVAPLVSPAPVAAFAPVPANLNEEEIRKEYSRLRDLTEKRDLTGIFSLMTEGVTLTDHFGKLHKGQETRDLLKGYLGAIKEITNYKTDILELNVNGDSASAVVRNTGKFSMNGPDGKPVTLDYEELDRDGWTKTPEGWRLKSIRVLMVRFSENGKVVRLGESPEAAAIREGLQGSYDQFLAAVRSSEKDVLKDMENALPTEFRFKTTQGASKTPGEMLALMNETFTKRLQNVKSSIELSEVQIEGDRVTVLRRWPIEGEMEVEGKKVPLKATVYSRDTWKRSGENLVPQGAEDTVIDLVVDGMPRVEASQ